MENSTTDLFARAARVLAGGATHVARTYRPAIHVVAARGSRKWLTDGREIVDYTMGHGALLLGHAHPAIVDAVTAQVARGTHYGAASELEVAWAERIVDLVPAAHRVRFTSSGTEAVMLALRLARAATGREVVVKFAGHFHGWSDGVTIDLDEAGLPRPGVGVPTAVATTTRVVRPDDTAALDAALGDGAAAALVLEPSGGHYGKLPLHPDVVRQAAERCRATDTLLVFDEVVTGFRVSPGGMQEVLGIVPDLVALAKIMAGGLPGGAVAGRADVMDLLGPTDGGGPTVVHPGTFNANPLSAAAGIACLDIVADGTPQRRAEEHAVALEASWRRVLEESGCPGRVWRLSSIVHLSLDDDTRDAALSNALRREGIDLLRTSAFCSAAHNETDLDVATAALQHALRSIG